MGYTALDKMREINELIPGYRRPIGPRVPDFQKTYKSPSMEYHALMFIREDCEALRFKSDNKHKLLDDREGRSTAPKQIPLHMEYDLDRLCLEKALERFFESGVQEDAFDVYYCYIEMFFEKKDSGRKMVELLSEYESNTSVLLSKHRDHYAHSVYVFAIGLALYNASQRVRNAYCGFYGLALNSHAAAHHFLRYWGFAALFHDMGYPFELAYEQIKSYFTPEGHDLKGAELDKIPFILYRNAERYMAEVFEPIREKLCKKEQLARFSGMTSVSPILLLADNLAERLRDTYGKNPAYLDYLEQRTLKDPKTVDSFEVYRDYIQELIRTKPDCPEKHKHHIDHAYFSVMALLRNLGELCHKTDLNPCYTDALTAILLHNSLFQHEIMQVSFDHKVSDTVKNAAAKMEKHPKPFRLEYHPLAYLLMLCDELQCWNRRSYGQSSRKQYHPCDCRLKLGQQLITATYVFDKAYEKDASGTYLKMPKQDGEKSEFVEDLEKIVALGGSKSLSLKLTVPEKTEPKPDEKQSISDSSYQHLYILATVLYAQYKNRAHGKPNAKAAAVDKEKANRDFNDLSLEYRLSNIAQAKQFGFYLQRIRCFYTDRDVACKRKTEFEPWELDKLGELEHQRWLNERDGMGWITGSWYLDSKLVEYESDLNCKKAILDAASTETQRRELIRVHKDMIPYWGLSDKTTEKDRQPLNDMMQFLEKNDGIQVYYLNKSLSRQGDDI